MLERGRSRGLTVGVGLAWGLAPWLPDHGLLVLLGCLGWAWLVRDGGEEGAGIGFLAAAVQLLWLPGTWTDGQGGGGGLVMLAVVLLQGLPALVAWGLARRTRGRCGLVVAVAASWAVAELVAPWTQPLPTLHSVLLADGPLWLAPAALGGRTLLTALAAGWGALVLERPRWGAGLTGLWLATALLPGPTETGLPVTVGGVEPDVHVLDARVPSHAPRLVEHLLSGVRSLDVDVVVTPEGAWPHDPGEAGSTRREAFVRALAGLGPVLVGATVGREAPRTNSVLAVVDGDVQEVDKRWLVPVWERSFLGFGRDRYVAGDGARVVEVGGIRLGVLVCYEDLFEGAVREAAAGDVLLAATNDAWLGTAGRSAHLASARLAAVSTGRYVVRPTLDGRSAVFDPRGRTLVALGDPSVYWPEAEPRVFQATVAATSGRPGAWLSPVLGALALVGLLVGGRR